ncbi:glycine and tyrosine-rich protein-like isoform X2 [Periplaneta americana]|uniref:glycine and tyrosine-rich protein-like isoform X2 n=1 Tax=Periplaneta americana TaxID=6978 RepID=UPI0037E9BCF9
MLVKIVCIALTLQGIVAVPYQRVKRSSDLVEVPKIPLPLSLDPSATLKGLQLPVLGGLPFLESRSLTGGLPLIGGGSGGLPVLSGVSGGLPLIGGGSGGLPILGGGPSGLLQGGKDGLPLVGGLTGGSDVLSGGKGVLAPVQDLPVVGGVAKGLL